MFNKKVVNIYYMTINGLEIAYKLMKSSASLDLWKLAIYEQQTLRILCDERLWRILLDIIAEETNSNFKFSKFKSCIDYWDIFSNNFDLIQCFLNTWYNRHILELYSRDFNLLLRGILLKLELPLFQSHSLTPLQCGTLSSL